MNVEVMLDVRAWSEPLPDSKALLALWQKVEPFLANKDLTAGQTIPLGKSDGSKLTVTVMAAPGVVRVGPETRFAVHSVVESSAGLRCDVCAAQGQTTYGGLLCWHSANEGKLVRLCATHGVILEGGLRAFHPAHVPTCSSKSGRPASFWCYGPLCREGKPWAADQRHEHPRDPSLIFCTACHKEQFSPCSVASCRKIGYYRCEYIEAGQTEPCRVPVCARHSSRWQIFGPEGNGLALCGRHAEIKSLTDELIVLQICLGTALRNLKGDPEEPLPPTLAAARHIFINVRNKAYEYPALLRLFQAAETRLTGASQLYQEARRLIGRRKPRWDDEIKRAPDPRGQVFLERVREWYRDRGLDEVADSLVLRDYKPPRPDRPDQPELLFVAVHPDAIGLLVGRQGNTIRAVSEEIGVKVALNKE